MSSLDSFFTAPRLPSMSEVSRALIKTFNQDNVTVADVRNILAQDAALSAKLLRMANSAQFGLPRGVGTLDEAITMIGMSPIRALAFGACLNDAFPTMPALEANPHTPGYRWKRELRDLMIKVHAPMGSNVTGR
jgi:HD-like signal output (HDOD) protein